VITRALIWLASITLAVSVWYGVLRAGLVSPAVLATPKEVVVSFPRLILPSYGLADTLATIERSLVAFAISVPIGIAVGMCIFFGGHMRSPAEFGLDFVRSIPATALVPVFLIVFGVDDTAKVSVGAFSSALVISVSTVAGLSSINSTRAAVATTLGISNLRRLLLLDIPEASPQIFLGFRTGVSLALILVIVAEMFIGTSRGLGRVISDMRFSDDKGLLYAAIVATGIIGFAYNHVIRAIEGVVLHWRGQ
jgi:NitT/TauT family transport system permease protein